MQISVSGEFKLSNQYIFYLLLKKHSANRKYRCFQWRKQASTEIHSKASELGAFVPPPSLASRQKDTRLTPIEIEKYWN